MRVRVSRPSSASDSLPRGLPTAFIAAAAAADDAEGESRTAAASAAAASRHTPSAVASSCSRCEISEVSAGAAPGKGWGLG